MHVQSTTAWAHGALLDETLERIASESDATVVEISIGAKPIADPEACLARFAHRFSFMAHHTTPVLPMCELRPATHTPDQVCEALKRFNITRYTIHPPTRRTHSDAEFLEWAWFWHDSLAENGIETRLETMYQPRDHLEALRTQGYHLDSALDTHHFVELAASRGWETPLLVDVSHLNIGLHGGTWRHSEVRELLAGHASDHFHVSSNDGRRDSHLPLTLHDPLWDLVALIPETAIQVDEARRHYVQV
jgi:hypothetical protein